jgi:hypothetical protein
MGCKAIGIDYEFDDNYFFHKNLYKKSSPQASLEADEDLLA